MSGPTIGTCCSTRPDQRTLLDLLIAIRDDYERLLSQVLGEGVGAGEFRKFDAGAVVRLLLGGLNWVCIWYKPRQSQTAKATGSSSTRILISFYAAWRMARESIDR